LAAEVRGEIAAAHRRVVGVVVNAVDDSLSKGEQIDTRWSRDEIKVLPTLLHEAKAVRRMVVMLADHGHVLDHQAQGRPGEGGERWRIDDGRPTAEMILSALRRRSDWSGSVTVCCWRMRRAFIVHLHDIIVHEGDR
jgi:hypothetical protein